MTDPLLEIEGLTFRYRRASEPAVRDVHLALHPGEVLLVAGPSGCGKSTLMRAMNGLIPHAYSGEMAGSVRVAGQPTIAVKLRDIALTVGTVLQDPARQIVGATVESELAFGPENLGMAAGEIRARIAAVAALTGIENLLGRDTAALSGGERQLVAVAGILMLRPRVLLVDEPLANLDPHTAARLLRILRGLADDGSAVVIVEHRVEEVLGLRPDRVLAMDEGRITYLGSVDGFMDVADPAVVKLPFEAVLARVRALGVGASRPIGPPAGPAAPAEAPPRLEYRQVRAAYDGTEVIRGVDMRLGAVERVAVLGPNGSGKTTLFRLAMRLLDPQAGAILVDGTPARARTTAELATTFGYVFQSPSQMLFARTVDEELRFGPRNLGRSAERQESVVSDALRRTGLDRLEGIRDRPPLTLSFGQQKRLALAIALALEPRTLILDEPSAGQDHRTATTFMLEIAALPGLESIYFVTHDVDLALTHADRILLLREGRIVGDGPPADVIRDEERWSACNLAMTSLARANRRWGPGDGRFLDALDLAHTVIAKE